MLDREAPCPTTIPEYYLITLHTIAFISIPTNCICLYLVWNYSPKASTYKYCLVYVQIVSFLTEMFMSLICPGYFFFPMLGGYNTGEFFGQYIAPHMTTTIWVLLLTFELPAIIQCFIFRHNIVLELDKTIKKRAGLKYTVTFLGHVFPFAASFCMFKSQLTTEQKYYYLKTNFPQCLKYFSFPAFEAYDFRQNFWIAITGVGSLILVLIFASYGLGLAFHTMIILQKLKKSMSIQTFKMHRTALISLGMQVIIPTVLLIIPLFTALFVISNELFEWQGIATNTMFLIGSHSLCSSLVMIFAYPRYRKTLISAFQKYLNFLQETRTNNVSSTANTISIGRKLIKRSSG